MITTEHYAIFRGYICTAREDGSIPIYAKSVCQVAAIDDQARLTRLFAQANNFVDLYAATELLSRAIERGESHSEAARAVYNAHSRATSKMPPEGA